MTVLVFFYERKNRSKRGKKLETSKGKGNREIYMFGRRKRNETKKWERMTEKFFPTEPNLYTQLGDSNNSLYNYKRP